MYLAKELYKGLFRKAAKMVYGVSGDNTFNEVILPFGKI